MASIREVQLKALEILCFFDSFCKEHGLRYFIAGGTLLGAVRHKGFIPWDDDIDIAMPRKDYECLLDLRERFPFPYQVINKKWDSSCDVLFTKIEDVTTTKVESVGDGKLSIGGISIDIFPQDGLPNSERKRRFREKLFNFLKLLVDYQNIHSYCLLRERIYIFCSWIVEKFYSPMKMLERYCSAYDYDASQWVRSSYGLYGDKETYLRGLHGEGCLLEFEGHLFNAPVCWEQYLQQMYGNYWELPPEEKRISLHNIQVIDLEHGYKEREVLDELIKCNHSGI